MITVLSRIMPGTERSSPRCWITSVCPIAAIASIAAKGSIDSSALLCRLLDASSGLNANISAVATQTPA